MISNLMVLVLAVLTWSTSMAACSFFVTGSNSGYSGSGSGTSAAAACSALAASFATASGGFSFSGTASGSICTVTTTNAGGAPTDSAITQTGVCDPPPPPSSADADKKTCEDASKIDNSTIGSPYQEVTLAGQISSGSSVCLATVGMSSPTQGCSANFELEIGYTKPDGTKVSRGRVDTQGGYVTLPCSLDNPTPPAPPKAEVAKCPAGQQMGQINGVDVCKPYAPGTTSTTVDGSATGGTPEAPTKTETNTVCNGQTCTTTTTTTTTGGAGAGTSSASTNTVPQGAFCSNNPTSAQCGGAAGGGTGGGGGASGECKAGTAGCTQLGGAPGVTAVPNTNKPLTITMDEGWGPANGTCPAPRVIALSFASIPMPFDLLCQFANGIRPLIIAMAYLGAAFSFIGIGRKD
jgi:hypothetical protein